MKYIYYLMMLIITMSCGSNQDEFYIDPLDITLSIEYLNNDTYRLHLDQGNSNYGENYIDFRYRLSEMPCMWLYFPYGKSDTIYIREENGRVESWQCKDYLIHISETRDRDSVPIKGLSLTYDKNSRYIYLTDSTLDEIPYVSVLIEPFLSETIVLDKINGVGYHMVDGVKEIYSLNTDDK